MPVDVSDRRPGDELLVSIIIKALNEEAKIARAIESALAAIREIGGRGEVILADSLSTDATVTIAQAYPVRIVQLTSTEDRSCGVGAQLGMCLAAGRFLYILDGDMELMPGFLPAALARLEAEPGLAGVAGVVEEMTVANQVFRRRQLSGDTGRGGQNLDCLNMGGLYRRSAVEPLGYLTNRNLHAFEEFELGIRLVAAGWRLERLPVAAVRHYGHSDSTYALLWRRWRTGHAWGHGELIREAWNEAHLGLAVRRLSLYRVSAFVLASWLLLVGLALSAPIAATRSLALMALYWLTVLILMAIRKRSLGAAAYSIVAWHFSAAGLLRGLLRRARTSATAPVAHRVLK